MLKSIYYLSIIYNLTEKLLLVTLLREKKTYKLGCAGYPAGYPTIFNIQPDTGY